MSLDHSLRQARTITQYWKERGFTVEPVIHAIPGTKSDRIDGHYVIRATMRNGWPRDYADKHPTAYEEKPGEHIWVRQGNTMLNLSANG